MSERFKLHQPAPAFHMKGTLGEMVTNSRLSPYEYNFRKTVEMRACVCGHSAIGHVHLPVHPSEEGKPTYCGMPLGDGTECMCNNFREGHQEEK